MYYDILKIKAAPISVNKMTRREACSFLFSSLFLIHSDPQLWVQTGPEQLWRIQVQVSWSGNSATLWSSWLWAGGGDEEGWSTAEHFIYYSWNQNLSSFKQPVCFRATAEEEAGEQVAEPLLPHVSGNSYPAAVSSFVWPLHYFLKRLIRRQCWLKIREKHDAMLPEKHHEFWCCCGGILFVLGIWKADYFTWTSFLKWICVTNFSCTFLLHHLRKSD